MKLGIRKIVVAGLLGGLSYVMAVTPWLGYIPVPTPAGSATTMHIPAIIAGILEGPVVGAFVGFIFGLSSFLRSTSPIFKDPLIAFGPRILIGVFAYYAFVLLQRKAARPVIAVAVGLLLTRLLYEAAALFNTRFAKLASPGAMSRALHGLTDHSSLALVLCLLAGAGLGYLTYLLVRDQDAPVAAAAIVGTLTNTVLVLSLIGLRFHWKAQALWLVGITHGLPEVLVGVVLAVPLVKGVRRALRRHAP
jgi:uncharacterized membrane protein